MARCPAHGRTEKERRKGKIKEKEEDSLK